MKIKYKKIILGIIGTAGLITLAMVAPNAIQCLPKLGILKRHSSDRRYYINKVVEGLRKKGLVKIFKNNENEVCVRLTQKGLAEIKEYELQQKTIKKPAKWDGKYRLVIFDIKEWKRFSRDSVRDWLEQLGFRRLQNSVWVYPYDCEEIVALIKTRFSVSGEVLYIIAEKIENDEWLKKEFDLGK